MPTIMIVDDDRTTTGLLKTLLELDGFNVVLAADGASAVQIAIDNKPDAFLVDFHLADFEGSDFIRDIRKNENFKNSPVIMASGLNRETEAKECGANHFLIKPFDPSTLVELFEKMLAK